MWVIIAICIILGIMFIFGLAFESDLKDLEKSNPNYRKFLKDKYDI
jgi:hypothetical protein